MHRTDNAAGSILMRISHTGRQQGSLMVSKRLWPQANGWFKLLVLHGRRQYRNGDRAELQRTDE
jgi:hypothetical protein